MASIGEIKEIYNNIKNDDIDSMGAFISEYEKDERAGVISLVKKAAACISAYKKEIERSSIMLKYENQYKEQGYKYICGIDEVGRGPLAGPVVACAVCLPEEMILYLNDSKQLSKKKREELYDIIIDKAVAYGIGIVSEKTIDDINILQATYEAMRQAVSNMSIKPQVMLNDAVTIPGIDAVQVPIIKGDAKSASIAAASIVAKVTRDRMMEEYDKLYPGYGFAENAGYGTAKHIEAIKTIGPTPIHRTTFIKNFI